MDNSLEDNRVEACSLLTHPHISTLKTTTENVVIRTLRSCCIIPQRYVLGVMGLLGICNAYTMRVCLNMAITQMVNKTQVDIEHFDTDACPSDEMIIMNATDSSVYRPYAIFDWSESTQGLILSGFYYGYAVAMIPGSYLTDRFGGKWSLGVGLLSTSLFTFLTPVAIRFGGATYLFALRVLQGMGESPTMPALMILLARWVPPHERSTLGALVFGGAQVGNIFGSFMSGILLADDRDWAYVFYFFGGVGLVWFILWCLFCFDTPTTHPYISKKELDYLDRTVIKSEHQKEKDPVPWKAILRSPPVWALLWASVGHDWGYYTMVSDLPKYATDVLKFNIATTGLLTALPYMAMWMCSFVFSFVCDTSLKRGWHSIKTGRIIYTSLGKLGPAICIILASYSGCDRNTAMGCFIASMALMSAYYSGMRVNALDLAPNFAGPLVSFCNTVSAVAGIITPYLVGVLTPDATLHQWRIAFWICFVVLVGTNLVYCTWAEGEQQWWDDVRQHGYPDGWRHGPLFDNSDKKEAHKPDLEISEK